MKKLINWYNNLDFYSKSKVDTVLAVIGTIIGVIIYLIILVCFEWQMTKKKYDYILERGGNPDIIIQEMKM